MKKRIFKALVIIVYFLVSLYIIHFSIKSDAEDIMFSTNSKTYVDEKVLEIPKIRLSSNISMATDDFSNLDHGLVYYKNFNPNNKIIIFGHSGMGTGTYFNKLDALNREDYVYIKNNRKVYKYVVKSVYKVSKYDTYILNDEENSKKLLLVTCVKFNKNKRLVVELALKNVKTVEK